jgi:hypothetical protein
MMSEGVATKRAILRRSSRRALITSEYGAVGEGDHAEIVDIEIKESHAEKILTTSAMMGPW